MSKKNDLLPIGVPVNFNSSSDKKYHFKNLNTENEV